VGRSNRPTRSVLITKIKPGDVVLIRYPAVANSRWMIVDDCNPTAGLPVVWSGRWAFGDDAGKWTIQRAEHSEYTVKDPRDARRVRDRLATLRKARLAALRRAQLTE
jgi:hypothetical protein